MKQKTLKKLYWEVNKSSMAVVRVNGNKCFVVMVIVLSLDWGEISIVVCYWELFYFSNHFHEILRVNYNGFVINLMNIIFIFHILCLLNRKFHYITVNGSALKDIFFAFKIQISVINVKHPNLQNIFMRLFEPNSWQNRKQDVKCSIE